MQHLKVFYINYIKESSIFENYIADYLPSDYNITPRSEYISPYSIQTINSSRKYKFNYFIEEVIIIIIIIHLLILKILKDNH